MYNKITPFLLLVFLLSAFSASSQSREILLAPVKIGDQWGYINKTGKIVINPQFDDSWGFNEGLAVIKLGGKWGYIDKTGKIVITPQFYGAGDFHEGLASIRSDSNW